MDTHPASRPDVFLFPPETSFRFYALMAGLFGAFAFVWAWLFMNLPSTGRFMTTYVQPCLKAAVGQSCLVPLNTRWGLFVLAFMVATGLAVLGLHLLRPRWVIRRQRLRPLATVVDPEMLPPLTAAIDALVAQAALPRQPKLLASRLPSTDAFTFGHWFADYIALDAGLIVGFLTDRAGFDAKLRHELAHLRNNDINKTGLTDASWTVFTIVVPLVVLYVFMLRPIDVESAFGLFWRFAVIVGAVWLARNAVIRAREYYADARAFVWDGPDGALLTAVRGTPPAADRRWPVLPALLRLHPSAQERCRALRQPDRILRTGLLSPAIVGLSFGIGEPAARLMLTSLFSADYDPRLGSWTSTFLLLLPLTCLAVVAVWRDSSRAVRRGGSDLTAIAFGVSAALGVMVGLRVSFVDTLGTGPEYPGPVPATLVLTLFFLWVRAGAYWWLSLALGRRQLLTACWTGIALGIFVLALVWISLEGLSGMLQDPSWPAGTNKFGIAIAVLEVFTVTSTTLLIVVVLWLYLALPRWIALRAAGAPQPWRRRAWQLLRWALAYAILLLAYRLAVREWVPPGVRETDAFREEFFWTHVKLAVLLQGALACWLTLRRPLASVGEAGCYVMLAALLMSAVALTMNVAFGGNIELSFARLITCVLVNQGAIAALIMGSLGSGLRFLFAGFQPLAGRPAPAVI